VDICHASTLFLLIGQCKFACILINTPHRYTKNWFLGDLKVNESKYIVKMEVHLFMQKLEVENFITLFLVPIFDLKFQAVDTIFCDFVLLNL